MRERLALILAMLCAFVFVGALGWSGYSIVQEDERLENALLALCALKDDLGRRVETAKQFLEDHPEGIPGIPRADFERSIYNQEQTLNSISPHLTDCPEDTL